MSYLICTVEEYNATIKRQVESNARIKKHSPIYSPDKSMVLVKGVGDMTLERVKTYQEEHNWWINNG